MRIELENIPYIIVETQFVKPGKGQAFTRLKLKNLLNGAVKDRTCKIFQKKAFQIQILQKNLCSFFICTRKTIFLWIWRISTQVIAFFKSKQVSSL